MRRAGKLRSWNDERGFGFIAPGDGGRELFVHVSAFARDGSRPTVGETVSFEVGPGKDGKPQALAVRRQALGDPATYPSRPKSAPARQPKERGSPAGALVTRLLVCLAVAGLGTYGYSFHQAQTKRRALVEQPSQPPQPVPRPATNEAAGRFRCDGRTHCSQMTSCAEATYFINHCSGTKMDGNGDGVPCEQQWCTGALTP